MTQAKTAPKKSTAKTEAADVFAIPGFAKTEVPAAIREFAETGAEKSKEAFENFKSASEEASVLLETSFEKTRNSAAEMSAKAADIAQVNTEAGVAHVKEVMAVKTFADALELQTAFMKKQMDVFQGQAKSFQDMSVKFAEETSAPYKAAFEKSLETFKVA